MGFWGVILESGKRYSQTVDESYHLTMASLEPPSGDGKKPSKYVSVMVEHQKTEFMICTLEPERNLQIALDHMFVAGEEVTFFLNGEGTVHLTGYLVPDDYDDYDEDLEDEEDEDEEVSDADSDSVKLVSTKRKNEALESSPEAVGKKAKVDSKLAKDSPNKTLKVEEKESINALKKKNEEKNFNKNLNDNKVSKIVPQNNKESDESEDEDDSDEDEEESDQEMDESLGLIDREAVEAEESDDEEEDESSDESDDESPQQKSTPFKGKPNKQNEQKQYKNKNQQNQQQNKSPQNQQQNKSPQNQQQNKSPQNQQQNKQKQFGSGQKGGFQGNQQKGNFQKGQWNQSAQKNQFGDNQKGWQQKKQFGGQNQGKNQQFGQQRGQQQNSPNFRGKQNQNFKGQQKGNFGTPNTPNFNQNKGETKEQKTNANQRKLEKGLIIEDLRVGNGPDAQKGKFIHVNYIGRLSNNKEFDRSVNKPFSFKLGRGEVIKGWDIGLEGMKVGGKRKIIVPPNMGYGNRPVGQIPANSTLSFEVELKSVT